MITVVCDHCGHAHPMLMQIRFISEGLFAPRYHICPDCLSESIKLAEKPLHRKRPAPDMKLDEDDILDF